MIKRATRDFTELPDDNPFLALVRDPLTQISRGHRKTLVALSGVSIAMWAAGLLPTQVSALGISLTAVEQVWFIRVLYCAVIYQLVTFVVYALLDYWGWQANLDSKLHRFVNSDGGMVGIDEAVEEALSGQRFIFRADKRRLKVLFNEYTDENRGTLSLLWHSSPMASVRLFIDLVLPFMAAVTAFCLLLMWDVPARQQNATLPQTPTATQGSAPVDRADQQTKRSADPGSVLRK